MARLRIASIENMIKKGFEQCRGFDSVVVVIGKYKEDDSKNNYIIILPIRNGESDHELSTQIETSNPDVLGVAEIVGLCLVASSLRFSTLQMLNMDGSKVDLDNPKSDLKLIVEI